MDFKVQSSSFDGPLHLLLELIQAEHLPITDISLSHIAQAYILHIEEHETPPEELADYLVIATKLILLKSQAILPIDVEPEEDPSTLALQLRLYKEFVDASRGLESLWDSQLMSFPREQGDVVRLEGFYLPSGLTAQSLDGVFAQLLKRLEPFFALQQSSIERVVSVQERLIEIKSIILSRAQMSFRQMTGTGKSKIDVVVTFLALLELVKQRVVSALQTDAFLDIEIKRVD